VTHAAVRLASLAVRDFRNFERLDLRLPEEGLAVIGENGHGKTNLLEALYYLQLLRSARRARDVDLVRFGAAGFHIAGTTSDGRTVSVGFERATKRKLGRLDGAPVEHMSDAIGAVPAVLISPADVELVAGAPVARRRYLDIVLALSTRGYLTALQTYRGALIRRNAALRALAGSGRGEAAVAVWDTPLARSGGVLWRARSEWISCVASRFASLCAAMGESGCVSLRHVTTLGPSDDPERSILDALGTKRTLEVRHGVTSAGPHRDGLGIALDGRDLRTFGSAGQQRSAAIALRLLEWETLRQARGAAPMLLLDDPFAELDARRSARILGLLGDAGVGQVVLTAPREVDIPHEFTNLERRDIVRGAVHARDLA
jgi:DNA replication and repair protein RecF